MPLSEKIKFTPYGVPYLVEFDKCSVRGSHHTVTSRKSSMEPDGLFIHSPQLMHTGKPISSRRRVRHLKEVISQAVLAAGMDSPPAAERADPMETAAMHQAKDSGSLFRGTYGQVATALKSAGLTITPCGEAGFGEATRLGALFVAKHHSKGVEFRKLTLWG